MVDRKRIIMSYSDIIEWTSYIKSYTSNNSYYSLLNTFREKIISGDESSTVESFNRTALTNTTNITFNVHLDGVKETNRKIRYAKYVKLLMDMMENENIHPVFLNQLYSDIPDHLKADISVRMTNVASYPFIRGKVNGIISWGAFYSRSISEVVDDEMIEKYGYKLDYDPEMVVIMNRSISPEMFKKLLFTIHNQSLLDKFFDMITPENLKMIDEECMTYISPQTRVSRIELISTQEMIKICKTNCSVKFLLENGVYEWLQYYNMTDPDSYGRVLASFGYNSKITNDDVCIIKCYLHNRPKYIVEFWRNLSMNTYCVKELLSILITSPRHSVSISRNTGITIDDVLSNKDFEWDWELLSANPSIGTPENVEKYPDLPWVWGKWGLSCSSSLTPEFIMKYKDDGLCFSGEPTIYPYDAGTVSSLHDVVDEDLIDNIGKDIVWGYTYDGLSKNENLHMDYVLRHSDELWDLECLATNISPSEDNAARAIQYAWKLWKIRQTCYELSEEVLEWWHSPDCKPASWVRSVGITEFENSSVGLTTELNW